MIIRRYEHACLTVTEGESKLVIDPGIFSTSFQDLDHVTALVITHVHPDHFDVDKVTTMLSANPTLKVFTVPAVAEKLTHDEQITIVKPSDSHSVEGLTLDFFGGKHALIHASIPLADNIGVLVNKTLFYPGDSFTKPGQPVKVLAIPGAAPWMQIGEAIDYLIAVKPEQAFPVHNAILSDAGLGINNRILENFAAENGIQFHILTPGMTLEVEA